MSAESNTLRAPAAHSSRTQPARPQREAFATPFGRYRVAGALTVATQSLSASRDPIHHRVLKRLGVLDRLPRSWPQAEVLTTMPWGSRRYAAPRADRPPGVEGPWPQSPRVHPSFSAPVLEVPEQDTLDHRDFNALRYLGQAATRWPAATVRALFGRRLEPLDDTRFDALIQDTLYAQFIRPGLDEADVAAFGDLLQRPPETYYKLDFSGVSVMRTIDPDLHVAPTVVLLDRDEETGRYRALAIAVGSRTVQPHEGPAWELARYFVLQNGALQVIAIWHPRLHFPHDSVHAITRALLPETHPIRRLITPHTRLTLGLHKAVIHHRRSVLHNSQRELYSPFPVTTGSIHRGVAVGLEGIPGNRSYPAFRWGDDLPGTHTTYGRYRQQWAEAFRRLCRGVLSRVPDGDPLVARWADHIRTFVAGFPTGAEVFRGTVLADAVATWMVGVTVFHTADHHSFGNIPLGLAPLRLRIPPPDIADPGPLDLDAIVRPEDWLRRQLAHEMFFAPVVVFPLSRVRYDFDDHGSTEAVRSFWDDVAKLDARWADSPFPTSERIAASIQY